MDRASSPNLAEFIANFRALQHDIPKDESVRKELYGLAQNLVYALESSIDTVKRIAYLPIQLAMTKIAVDLRIFKILASSKSPMSTTDLATQTKADPVLLHRVLQYLASVCIILRNGNETFSATGITRTLAEPGFEAAIKHHYEVHLPAWAALAGFLADTSYANPCDDTHTAFQAGHHTRLPAYKWAVNQPRLVHEFNEWMVAQRRGEKSWLDVVPPTYITDNSELETPLFVDIGGGVGHQCAALVSAFPNISRRVVLQDLQAAIEHAQPAPGVECMMHDFWDEQPVKGASIYYLRNVLHNYPDSKAIALLQNIMQAMAPTSVIFIDEIALAADEVHWHAAQLDITMMASLGAMERSQTQWKTLLGASGLEIRHILTYSKEAAQSLIVAVRK